MQASYRSYEIDTDFSRIDFGRVHSWLTEAYWSPGVSREKVERAANHSADVIGVYAEGQQIAYCRIVSDKTTFAWLSDVFVDPNYRGQGVAKAMVRFALDLPYSADLRRWVLSTRDAEKVYAECGFKPLENAHCWMAIQRQTI